MYKYEFMQYAASVTLDYIAQDLSKLVNAEVVCFTQSPYGMTVLIKLPAPTDAPGQGEE